MKKVIIMLLIFLVLLLVCCDSEQKNNKESNSLNVGFSSEEPSPPTWISITSDKTKVKKGEDLILNVCYGTSLHYPDDFIIEFHEDDVLPCEISVDFIIKYGRCTKELIHKGKNIFDKSEYSLHSTKIGETVYKTIDEFGVDLYSRYEKIVLSTDLFTEEMGYIAFAIKINSFYDCQGNGSSALYYKNNNGVITLYDSRYSFYHNVIR